MNNLREAKRQAELYTETMLDETTMEHDNAITHALIAIAEQLESIADDTKIQREYEADMLAREQEKVIVCGKSRQDCKDFQR